MNVSEFPQKQTKQLYNTYYKYTLLGSEEVVPLQCRLPTGGELLLTFLLRLISAAVGDLSLSNRDTGLLLLVVVLLVLPLSPDSDSATELELELLDIIIVHRVRLGGAHVAKHD